MTIALVVVLLIVVALVSWLLTGIARRYSLSRALMDVPNERSVHRDPVPRGGGMAMAISWLLLLPVLWWIGALESEIFLALFGGGFVMAVTGWWDDHGHLPARVRLLAQAAAALWTVTWVGGVHAIDLGPWVLDLGAFGSLIAVLGMVWFINLYNFMDGIDGLAASEAVIGSIMVGSILWYAGGWGLALACWSLGAAAGGFLFWNWPPAKIFMGDVGSYLLGFGFGTLVIAGEMLAGVPLVILLIPFGVFICDATVTLLLRLVKGERVYMAHRSHAYQRLVQSGWTHSAVTWYLSGINLVLGGVAWWAFYNREALPVVVVSTIVSLILLVAGTLFWARNSAGSGPLQRPFS